MNETWAALVAAHQSVYAEDAALRAIYRRITADEARHAELAWAIGSVLAGIGGLFLGQLQIVSTELESIGLLALPAVVIGGMQSIPGAIIGGLLVGLIEQFAGAYISPKSSDILIYVLLMLILMFRPWGLFGQRELGRV